MEVQTVVSPGGIEAWLVEDSAEPMFALHFAFRGGSAQDPAGKEGLANFVAMMLDRGGGHLDAIEFDQRLDSIAAKFKLEPALDAVVGSIEALSEAGSEVAQLVGLALASPRLDDTAFGRVRRRFLSFHGGESRRPRMVADMQWNAVAFPGHAYGRQHVGNADTVGAISLEDVRSYHRHVFARDRLKVAAVGDITPEELGVMLDRLFAGLPATGGLTDIPPVAPVTGGRLRVAEMELPQSVVAFGAGSINYDSPDYVAAGVLNYILGASGLSSRLVSELRQKRGLVFEAWTVLERRSRGVVLRGRLYTRNGNVAQALDVVRDEMTKLGAGDVTQAELDDAKSYLIRSYPVEFGSPSRIAAQLLRYAADGFGPAFFEERKAMIAAVTREDVTRAAGQMLDPENLIVSIAGTPALQPRP